MSTAILCIAQNETPFVEEWLEYHLALGFDRIYYISTDDDFEHVRAYMDKLPMREQVELLRNGPLQGIPGQRAAYSRYLPRVQEDWVLVLDLDEFLHLGSFPSIQALLDSHDNLDQIHFWWSMVWSDRYHQQRVLDVAREGTHHARSQVKSIVRTDLPGLTLKPHRHTAQHIKSLALPREQASVLHVCSRGHLDTLTRIVASRFGDIKAGPAEHIRAARFLRGKPTWKNIPARYLMLKIYGCLPLVETPHHVTATVARTDVDEQVRIFLRNIPQIAPFEGVADVATRFEQTYRLREKLAAPALQTQTLSAQHLKNLARARTQLGRWARRNRIERARKARIERARKV
jgi:hypothetical protein